MRIKTGLRTDQANRLITIAGTPGCMKLTVYIYKKMFKQGSFFNRGADRNRNTGQVTASVVFRNYVLVLIQIPIGWRGVCQDVFRGGIVAILKRCTFTDEGLYVRSPRLAWNRQGERQILTEGIAS